VSCYEFRVAKMTSDKKFDKLYDEMKEFVTSNAKGRRNQEEMKKKKLATMPSLVRQSSEAQRQKWAKERDRKDIKEPYQKAYDMICLEKKWIGFTKAIEVLEGLGNIENKLKELQDKAFFESVLLKVIMQAYNLKSEKLARKQSCVVNGNNIYTSVLRMFNNMKWRKPYLTLGFLYWIYLGDGDSSMAKMSEIVARATRCLSVQRLGFDAVIKHADALAVFGPKPKAGKLQENEKKEKITLYEAKRRCAVIFGEYLDQHKDYAFDAAFRQPLTAYYMDQSMWNYPQYFNNHGINYWLAGILSTLGMQLPIVPHLSDFANGGHCDIWGAKGTQILWDEYQKKENFGRKLFAISKLKEFTKGGKKKFGSVTQHNMKNHPFSPNPKTFADGLNTKKDAKLQKQWAIYIERLAHFFTWNFFCEKAICVLMQEDTNNPRMLGFRKYMGVIYEYYVKEKLSKNGETPEETMEEHVFDDVKNAFDIARVNNLFHYAGFTKKDVEVSKRSKVVKKETKIAKMEYDGDEKILNKVEGWLDEGNNQMQIFSLSRKEGLGKPKEIMLAIRYARYKKAVSEKETKKEEKKTDAKSEKKSNNSEKESGKSEKKVEKSEKKVKKSKKKVEKSKKKVEKSEKKGEKSEKAPEPVMTSFPAKGIAKLKTCVIS